ncbi:MAG: putative transporter substrate binding protein, partial [Bacteroidetes bacterium]|nr:putative transporter substrate binding protein [Bacteroidota bacterium]
MNRLRNILVAAVVTHATVFSQTNLQSLINAASRGDTILVTPGTYHGNLVLDKPLALRGLGNPVVRGDSSGIVITIAADSCTVQGFTIERSGDNLMHE